MKWVARKKDWRQFWRYKSRIQRIVGSDYLSALLLTPEVAEEQAKAKLPKLKNPALFRYTSLDHRLTDIADILLKSAAARGGGDPGSASIPRPITAMDHLEAQNRRAYFNHIHSKATPRRAG